ncbi:MAG: amidohydrolase family protein [Planctomycetota bacterium]|jgi:predicted TIM-barrel fold metal-dependent hydrolase
MTTRPTSMPAAPGHRVHAANRLGLDYAGEAARLGPPPAPVIDAHTHVGGVAAARIYRQVAELYGVRLTYSMTHLEQVDDVRSVLGDAVRFIAVPNWQAEDKRHHLGRGFIRRIEDFHAAGARIAKFWAAPRGTDYATELGEPDFMRLDAPHRIDAMETAAGLGMVFMVHVADPDTWFATKYRDASVYGTKAAQYEPFEAMLERFDRPWIAAHLGGWPEDLEFLTGLLDRHANLRLDTSATKWMVRELSRHARDDVVAFLARFRGRILFGSDIVTSDDHLRPEADHEFFAGASSPDEAFDLYASRYWALLTLLETDHDGESPIADPDLALVDPDRHGPLDAPRLRGLAVPPDLLRSIYHDAAGDLLEPLHAG